MKGRGPVWAGAVLGAVLAGSAAMAVGGSGAASDSLPTVTLKVRHSRFVPAVVQVKPGTEVRFVIDNTDPITHEFIVGPGDVHERHETGTEARHGAVPGEVTLDPDQVAETTYRFDQPGEVVFACHLPGHLAYGMKGVVQVGG